MACPYRLLSRLFPRFDRPGLHASYLHSSTVNPDGLCSEKSTTIGCLSRSFFLSSNEGAVHQPASKDIKKDDAIGAAVEEGYDHISTHLAQVPLVIVVDWGLGVRRVESASAFPNTQ
jgi:hypothetical protein